jgi:hypothetical protein
MANQRSFSERTARRNRTTTGRKGPRQRKSRLLIAERAQPHCFRVWATLNLPPFCKVVGAETAKA